MGDVGAELRVLGPLEVVEGESAVTLPGRKHRRLLAALAIAKGRMCTVDALVEAVWDDRPPRSARKLVQVYVSQLRRVLPEPLAVTTKPSGYVLDVPGDSLDALRFERLASDAAGALAASNPALAAALADRALGLWRGPAYADVAYEDFARADTERLEYLRAETLEVRIEARLALGQHDGVLGSALALADEHPLRERAQRLAMLALYRSGRQAEALDRFTQVRRLLDDELGLEPGQELRDLQRLILEQDSSLEPQSPPSMASDALPVPPTPLVGREAELESLRQILDRREIRLLVLTGAGGSGKTRLALEAVRELAPTYANGAVLVELAPLRDPELVVPTIAQRLEVSAAPGQELRDALVDAIRGRELLLVLDNAEHLRAAAPLFAELLAKAPRLTLLVTSRAVLHLSGEYVFPVPPLEEQAAVELFEQRARARHPTFRATTDDRATIDEVCARVDRLPLAIELAAGRMGTLSLAALRERLGDRLALLTGGPRDLPARQQTLRETLDWSASLLTPPERAVLARIAIFPGGATLDAAQEVCRADLDTLTALVDLHLARRIDVGDIPRFGLLETIREYALELLGADRGETERAFVTYVLRLVEDAYVSREESAWMARLDAELDNLRGALDWAAARSESELELRLAGGLWRFWWARGHLDEGLARLESALGRAEEGSPARVRAMRGAAGLAWSRGLLELADARATGAVALAREHDDPHELLGAHTVLGALALGRRDFEGARTHYEESVAIRQRLGLEPVVEKLNLAVVTMESGDPGSAVALLEDVLDANRRSDDLVGVVGFATLNLGQAHYRLGDLARAAGRFEEARAAFTEIGFRAHVAHALQGLAACAASSDRHEDAARLLGRAAAELGEIVDSDEHFALLAAEVETAARVAIGDEAYEAAFAAGRSGGGR